jgi:hypothetical protein
MGALSNLKKDENDYYEFVVVIQQSQIMAFIL